MKKCKYNYIKIGILLLGLTGCGMNMSDEEPPSFIIDSSISSEVEQQPNKDFVEQLGTENVSDETGYNQFHRMLTDELGAREALFCIDEITGISYFVNQGKDYYLYQLRDGKASLAVEMPVKEVFTYGGFVYFMIENYDIYELEKLREGDIYCYNPSNSEVQLVHEAGLIENAQNYKLKVDETGVYFSYSIEEKETSEIKYYYHLPFDDEKYMTEEGWGNYRFGYMSELVLISRTEGEKDVKNLSMNPFRYCVVGDMLYSVELGRTVLSCLNLRTEKKIEYDFSEVVKQVHTQFNMGEILEETVVFQSFLVMGQDIWMAGPRALYHMDIESEVVTYYKLVDEEGVHCGIKALYTDGKQLYGLTQKEEEGASVVVRILTKEIEEDAEGVFCMKVEELTE